MRFIHRLIKHKTGVSGQITLGKREKGKKRRGRVLRYGMHGIDTGDRHVTDILREAKIGEGRRGGRVYWGWARMGSDSGKFGVR